MAPTPSKVHELCYFRYVKKVPDEGYNDGDDDAPYFQAYEYTKRPKLNQLRGMARGFAEEDWYGISPINAVVHRRLLVPSIGQVWSEMEKGDDAAGALLRDQRYFYDNTAWALREDDGDPVEDD